ncbi:nuclear transport factor 2 family protein [Chitinophaga nivalis]|uniref:Nuclear transport factor 2 family protein n=1 Tax=Chitinophaga nivalis TaxID=2991709 RepID=A0ABT3IGT2_9BACT|nr:nuclear transport factor 2 family protein [Chitinophaga nivalis]MCW3467144.1 nuclear transport factor 2 family protein [Chitinophaga nivalis]MCW3483165.1 nuclear transport factor 2 family protein [Chitinophaga nivalis]
MTNKEIVQSTYEGKTSEENGKNLAAAVAPDVRWTETAGFPYAGTYTGITEITRHVFDRLATEWIDYKVTIDSYVAEGDQVVAYGTYSGIWKATGKPMKARVAHLWTLKAGKIVSFEQFADSKKVVDAMH